jgi:hypothetical protein
MLACALENFDENDATLVKLYLGDRALRAVQKSLSVEDQSVGMVPRLPHRLAVRPVVFK